MKVTFVVCSICADAKSHEPTSEIHRKDCHAFLSLLTHGATFVKRHLRLSQSVKRR